MCCQHIAFAILEQPFQKDAMIEVGHHAVSKKNLSENAKRS